MFCKSIDINAIEYKPPTQNKNGGRVVACFTKPGSMTWEDRIRFQMSPNQNEFLQTAIWGLSTPLAGQDPSRRTLELSIPSPELMQFLSDLDARNQNVAKESCQAWFKKSLDDDAIKQMYVSLVKPPAKEDSEPTVRVKVKCGNTYPTNIYLVENDDPDNFTYTKGSPNDLVRNAKCLVMVETVGLWFMSRQFGMSLTASEILVWPTKRNVGINAFTLAGGINPKMSSLPVPKQIDMNMEMEEDDLF